jgi:colanic acid/amylovoran/stewartan biosynthesis glycosyltransferase WcaL/AmsK/CpsK
MTGRDSSAEETTPGPPARVAVAHIHDQFFAPSETFIYGVISRLSRFRPVCLANRFVNLDAFPFPAADSFETGGGRYTPRSLVRTVFRKLTGRDPYVERILRRAKARLLHAHFGPSGVRALLYKRGTGLPLVTTFYGYDVSALARHDVWRRRYERLFAEGDLFLVEGPSLRDKLVALGCPAARIEVQRIGIPVEEIAFRPRAPRPPGEKAVAIFSGRFVEKKGLKLALAACAAARTRTQDFEFRIIGDGPLRDEIERTIERLGMQGYVRLLGFLGYADYLREMAAADFFLHPSLTASDGDSEGGAPTTILEAQAAGLPIVSTTHADIPNVVLPGRSALLAPEGDAAALADHITLLVTEQERWRPMGAAGRQFVAEHHDVRRQVEALEDRYERLIRSS